MLNFGKTWFEAFVSLEETTELGMLTFHHLRAVAIYSSLDSYLSCRKWG